MPIEIFDKSNYFVRNPAPSDSNAKFEPVSTAPSKTGRFEGRKPRKKNPLTEFKNNIPVRKNDHPKRELPERKTQKKLGKEQKIISCNIDLDILFDDQKEFEPIENSTASYEDSRQKNGPDLNNCGVNRENSNEKNLLENTNILLSTAKESLGKTNTESRLAAGKLLKNIIKNYYDLGENVKCRIAMILFAECIRSLGKIQLAELVFRNLLGYKINEPEDNETYVLASLNLVDVICTNDAGAKYENCLNLLEKAREHLGLCKVNTHVQFFTKLARVHGKFDRLKLSQDLFQECEKTYLTKADQLDGRVVFNFYVDYADFLIEKCHHEKENFNKAARLVDLACSRGMVDTFRANMSRGKLYFELNRLDMALKYFKQALIVSFRQLDNYSPRLRELYIWLASCYERTGQKDLARSSLKKMEKVGIKELTQRYIESKFDLKKFQLTFGALVDRILRSQFK